MEITQDIIPSSVTVLKASAGSGKTYALTRRFLQLLLSPKVRKSGLRNIIAITFSNNAAIEMKQRILKSLKEIALGADSTTVEELLQGVVDIDRESIINRAKDLVEEIIENYSDFQVKTIDSLMTSLFKATAVDFGFTEDFEIVMDNSELFRFAFDSILRQVIPGSPFASLIESITEKILESRQSSSSYPWDPSSLLLKETKGIYRKVTSLGREPRAEELSELEDIKLNIKRLKEEISEIINRHGLALRKTSSGVPTWERFAQAVERDSFTDLWHIGFNQPPVKKDKKAVEAYNRVSALWAEVKELVREYTLAHSLVYYNPYIQMFQHLKDTLDRTKKLQGKVFIEDINYYLSEYLTEDIVPDVYFCIGERIYHWLIDEFQDTSPIQWRNLTPLIENSISEGGTLFVVGDTKQSIYGFRDADYRIMRSLERENLFPTSSHTVEELPYNYRSKNEIVRFSEKVFKENVKDSNYAPAAEASGLSDYTQSSIPEKSQGGYVEVITLSRDDEEETKRCIIGLIRDLCRRGYNYSDIAVLTYRNHDVLQISTWLNDGEIPFVSYSSLDIRRRKITNEIASLLRFLDSPMNDLAFSTFVLSELFLRSTEQEGFTRQMVMEFLFRNRETRPLYKAFRQEYPLLWDRHIDNLFRMSGYLPIYDMLVSIYHEYRVFELFPDEEATLVRLLETVKETEGRAILNLKDFLRYLEEDSDESIWTISVPREGEAVRVMTIHKSKGLGFPVVILFLYENRINRGFPYIWAEQDGHLRLLKINGKMTRLNEALAKRYDEEVMINEINALNTLYVGLTRAEEEMYVLLASRNEDKRGFPLDILPDRFVSTEEKPKAEVQRRTTAHKSFPVLFKGHPYVYEVDDRTITYYEKKRGEALHRLLEKIEYIDNGIEECIQRLCKEVEFNSLTSSDIDTLVKTLNRVDLRKYFQKKAGREILIEKEFSDRWGALYRMDRVVVDPERVTVIDFKTGAPTEEDLEKYRTQITIYMDILRGIYPKKEVKGVLVFLDLCKIYEVS